MLEKQTILKPLFVSDSHSLQQLYSLTQTYRAKVSVACNIEPELIIKFIFTCSPVESIIIICFSGSSELCCVKVAVHVAALERSIKKIALYVCAR